MSDLKSYFGLWTESKKKEVARSGPPRMNEVFQITEADDDEQWFQDAGDNDQKTPGLAGRFGGIEKASDKLSKKSKKSSHTADRFSKIGDHPPAGDDAQEEPPEEIDVTPPGLMPPGHPAMGGGQQEFDATRPPNPQGGQAELERWMKAMQNQPRPPWLPPGAPWPPPMDPDLKQKQDVKPRGQQFVGRKG